MAREAWPRGDGDHSSVDDALESEHEKQTKVARQLVLVALLVYFAMDLAAVDVSLGEYASELCEKETTCKVLK